MIKSCIVYSTGGGCYCAEGQLADGLYFQGDLENGFMLLNKPFPSNDFDYDNMGVIYLNDKENVKLSKKIINLKLKEHLKEDNFSAEELKHILYRIEEK